MGTFFFFLVLAAPVWGSQALPQGNWNPSNIGCHLHGIGLRWDMCVSSTVNESLKPESSTVGCLLLMDLLWMQSRTIIFHLKACEVVLLIESGMLRNKTPKDFCRKFLSKHFFFNFLFLLGIFLCSETFWIYHVESAVSTMLLILSNSQHSVLIACRTVSKKALGENQEIKQCQQNKGKQYFYFFFSICFMHSCPSRYLLWHLVQLHMCSCLQGV